MPNKILSMDENTKDVRYTIINPKGKRRSFVLTAYILITRKDKKTVPVSDKLRSDVVTVNQRFLAGTIEQNEARALLEELVQAQYRGGKVRSKVLLNSLISETNQKVFNKFWSQVYGVRYIDDEASARYDLLKSIRLIEPHSLLTSTQQELQTALKKSGASIPEVRRASDRLNQIIRFLKRDLVLQKPKPELKEVQHLTLLEFKKVLPHFRDNIIADFAMSLFASGARLSEGLALTGIVYENDQILISKQMVRGCRIKKPKRDKEGWVGVLLEGKEALMRWISVQDKEQYRYKLAAELEYACRKAFPNNPKKWLGPHDLRHSHAIHLLGKGASLDEVSNNLRNTPSVCRQYYTGFVHSQTTLNRLKRLL